MLNNYKNAIPGCYCDYRKTVPIGQPIETFKPGQTNQLLKSLKMANLLQQNYPADEDYPDFTGHHSLLSKYLTKEIYARLRDVTTSSGCTIDRAIQNGVDNHDFHLGILAGDEECYELYAELFDPVIEEYHNGFKKTDNHVTDLDSSKLTGEELDSNYVISSRIRTGRNIRGFALSPHVTRGERREIENLVSEALGSLGGDLSGKYYSLLTLSPEDQQQLIDDHFLFEKPVSRHFLSGVWEGISPTVEEYGKNNKFTYTV
ncbi:putative arginine kinase [Apostichopus japonicus]|uniref:Putative arginine kinase n=1 Tax=Stichopus japonicus TaxID=307972 RepID=A0A2G8JI45_STIJA|nr:putative arginine kinase [Apostichopus japonicus]